tara:strand:- start:568 stop:921 length:354 start_codon:yes stop_codon:yes gene_type:complete
MEECCICLEEFSDTENLKKLSCNHVIHTKCYSEITSFNKYKNILSECPLCRNPIDISDTSSSTVDASDIEVLNINTGNDERVIFCNYYCSNLAFCFNVILYVFLIMIILFVLLFITL